MGVWKAFLSMLALALAAGVVWVSADLPGLEKHRQETEQQLSSQPPNLAELLAMPHEGLRQIDIARVNLLCAEGLPGSADLNLSGALQMVDTMAARVRAETERHLYRFRRDPSAYENSEGFFRMMMLAVVLAEDFGVAYAPEKIGTTADAREGDGFFADCGDVFLPGLTGPRHRGTCSSMPVLQVAVGRRLGYPLKLVTTKGHLFLRWEDARERFNIEATGKGVSRFSDDYYRHWPLEVSEREVRANGYLKSLTAPEELAVFLSIRGMCWAESGRYDEAAASFEAAKRLAPGCESYTVMAREFQNRTGTELSKTISTKLSVATEGMRSL